MCGLFLLTPWIRIINIIRSGQTGWLAGWRWNCYLGTQFEAFVGRNHDEIITGVNVEEEEEEEEKKKMTDLPKP